MIRILGLTDAYLVVAQNLIIWECITIHSFAPHVKQTVGSAFGCESLAWPRTTSIRIWRCGNRRGEVSEKRRMPESRRAKSSESPSIDYDRESETIIFGILGWRRCKLEKQGLMEPTPGSASERKTVRGLVMPTRFGNY